MPGSLGTYYGDSRFWLALFLLVGMFWMLREGALLWRAAAVVASSLLVLHLGAGVALGSLGMLLGGMLWAYGCARAMRSVAQERPNLVAFVCSAPMLVAWSFGRFVMPGSALSILVFAGFSFFVVKLFSVSKDIADGAVEKADPLTFAAYLLFFPGAPSGPMHKYEEFEETLRAPSPPSGQEMVEVVYRLLLGFAKVKVVAPLLAPMSLAAFADWHELAQSSAQTFVIACVAYSLVLYMDFSGYSDLAISCGRLIGLHTPENFRAPYLAPNIREFWQRWHITFTRLLTGYLFTPLSRWLQQRGLAPRAVMIVAYLATFGFCGFWHGARLNMIAWGGYHALGLIAYDLTRPKPVARGRGQSTPKSPWKRALAISATFGFVSIGWSLFAVPFTR